MFGTFGQAFFAVYETLLPLEPGFHELRSALYKLYPTLVHVPGLFAADRADVEACWIVDLRKKNRPGMPGPVFPAKRAELQRHCLLDGLWLAPPFYS